MAKGPGRVGTGGRLEGGLDEVAARLNASVSFDRRLAFEDIDGSLAHARMLAAIGILSDEDLAAIEGGLAAIGEEIEADTFAWSDALEDVHMNIEARLIERIGDAGKRLHTARSRNDQVATDLRLWVAKAATALDHMAAGLQAALVDTAKRSVDVVMPGYTHLQRAQPIRAAHHLMAYVEMLRRDRDRLRAARDHCLEECPLGSGALAATPFPIDRERVAEELGFEAPSANSMDAVGSRDFALEFLSAAAICAVHLSRLGEELVNWASAEFSFVDLPDAYCTSSSIMPQKKNPDIAELVRAKAGRVCGDLQTLLMVVKGLPLAYDKDLQEDKEPVFDAADTLALCLRAMAGLVEGLRFDAQRCGEAAAGGYTTATDVADWLVQEGVPFREAHGVVGRMVKDAAALGAPLSDLSDEALTAYHPALDPTVRQCLDPVASVDRRDVVGGPARTRVLDAIAHWEEQLA